MDFMHNALFKVVPEVAIPKSLYSTKRVLVMSFVEGNNLCKLAEFKDKNGMGSVPGFIKDRIGRNLLNVLAKAWGEMIFELQYFNADPHPGNICISSAQRDGEVKGRKVGLLDWGQMKRISDVTTYKFAKMVDSIHHGNASEIAKSFFDLGMRVSDPTNTAFVSDMAMTMLDTRKVSGFVIDPFSEDSSVKNNTVASMPSDLYFLVRTVQLMRGISYAFGLDYSLADSWAPYAKKAMLKAEKRGILALQS
jgi:aarF domain-containing kinase